MFYVSPIILAILITVYGKEENLNPRFVDQLMYEYDANGTVVPGASVTVICSSKLVIHRSYGFADMEEQVKTYSNTNYRLASLTKQFTAAAVLLLAEKKNDKLQLDDLVRKKWLPTLPLATDGITIRHLLTHTSGIIDYEDVVIPDDDLHHQLHDSDVLDILASQNRTYFTPPGSRYRYSNSGYALLALIVEKASGKRFANFLQEQIFSPLAMYETVAYEDGISTLRHRAFGYSSNESSWMRTDQSQTSAVLGDGGIYSSIDDLVKWDAALNDDRLLSLESLLLAFTPATQTDDPTVQYGMGWQITGNMVWHSGSTIGFRNVILRFPTHHLTTIILTNRNYPEPYQMALTIAHHFLNARECINSFAGTEMTSCYKTLALLLIVNLIFVIYSL